MFCPSHAKPGGVDIFQMLMDAEYTFKYIFNSAMVIRPICYTYCSYTPNLLHLLQFLHFPLHEVKIISVSVTQIN